MSAPKFLLKNLFKRSRRKKRASGFTLLELLVALVLTFLIITPLMTLVVTLMNNDRQEQAKNSSQQEIQAALDYIAQDLQQAVYIYDASALSTPNNSSGVGLSGIKDQIPPAATAPGCNASSNCVPVLAFWKRKYLDRNDTINNVKIGAIADSSAKSDRYVYSLVVYYLIKDTGQSNNQTWSPVARVGRFEIRDGIQNSSQTPPVVYLPPSDGFKPFDLTASPGSVQQSMNLWTKASGTYTNSVDILIDYIDDSLLTTLPPGVKNQFSPPVNDTTNIYGYLTSTTAGQIGGKSGCEDQTGKASSGTAISAALPGSSRVPPAPPAALDTGSFYACVNPINDQGQSVAQVYLRGNALPRLNSNSKTWEINAANQISQLSYRPTGSVRVAVRGLLSNQSN